VNGAFQPALRAHGAAVVVRTAEEAAFALGAGGGAGRAVAKGGLHFRPADIEPALQALVETGQRRASGFDIRGRPRNRNPVAA